MTTKRISVTQPLYIIETKKEFMNNYKLVNNNDWIAIATVFVAISAIFIGAWQANETLHATIKPLLDIETMDYPYEKNIVLQNQGLGPAVITKVEFFKNDIYSKEMSDFINLPYNGTYDSIYSFGSEISYIKKEDEIILAKISLNHFKNSSLFEENKYNTTQINEIMSTWAENVSEIIIRIDYEDILGRKETLERLIF